MYKPQGGNLFNVLNSHPLNFKKLLQNRNCDFTFVADACVCCKPPTKTRNNELLKLVVCEGGLLAQAGRLLIFFDTDMTTYLKSI